MRPQSNKSSVGGGCSASLAPPPSPLPRSGSCPRRPEPRPPSAPRLNTNSAPSELKITDMRACTVAANYDYPIIRIDTNQGVYGLGEVRDAGVKGIALILKAHMLGKNPLRDRVDPATASGSSPGRAAWAAATAPSTWRCTTSPARSTACPPGACSARKYRDRIRIYCDTTGHKDPKIYAERMLRRKKMGFTFFKMDLYTSTGGATGPAPCTRTAPPPRRA